jgi:hypothetical protein
VPNRPGTSAGRCWQSSLVSQQYPHGSTRSDVGVEMESIVHALPTASFDESNSHDDNRRGGPRLFVYRRDHLSQQPLPGVCVCGSLVGDGQQFGHREVVGVNAQESSTTRVEAPVDQRDEVRTRTFAVVPSIKNRRPSETENFSTADLLAFQQWRKAS